LALNCFFEIVFSLVVILPFHQNRSDVVQTNTLFLHIFELLIGAVSLMIVKQRLCGVSLRLSLGSYLKRFGHFVESYLEIVQFFIGLLI